MKTVWKKIDELKPLQPDNIHTETSRSANGAMTEKSFYWVNNIDYRGYRINWQECFEMVTCAKGRVEKKHFVHITDLSLNQENIATSSYSGRLRWKIENEGFNSLKNRGYGLKYKWTLTSYQGLKNYFQFMQMGHLIN